jgi:hypothetical protein
MGGGVSKFRAKECPRRSLLGVVRVYKPAFLRVIFES